MCSKTAVATLSYSYAEGVVWLDDLAPEAHPMIHDLCPRHAETITVPVGWELRDQRSRVQPVGEGSSEGLQLDLIGA